MNKTRNSFLAEFLKGYAGKDEVVPLLSQYNIVFEYNCFAVVAINITSAGAAGHGTVKDAIFIVDNITRDCVGDGMNLTRIDADGKLFYLVNLPGDVNVKEEVMTVFAKVTSFAQSEINLWFSVSMSSVSQDLESVPTLYREAMLAMDYGIFYGVDDFFFYDEVKTEPESPDLIKNYFSDESVLIYHLRESELKRAQELVDNLLTNSNNAGVLNHWQFNWLLYNIMNAVMKSVDPANADSISEIVQYANKHESCRDLGEIKQFFNNLLRLHVELNSQKNMKNKNTGDRIKEYIDTHITDPELCAASIGATLELSPLYLARLFKN